jgi:hypothetical protein
LRKTRHRGAARVGWMFNFALAAYIFREAVRPEPRLLADAQDQALEALAAHRRQVVEMLKAENNHSAAADQEPDLMLAETFRSLPRITHPDVTHSSTT